MPVENACSGLPRHDLNPLTINSATTWNVERHDFTIEKLTRRVVKEELENGWKFDPVKNSDPEASTCPNPIENLTRDEYEWVQNLKLSRTKAEIDKNQRIDDISKQYITWQTNWKSTDRFDPLDDASFYKVVDGFYADIETHSNPVKDMGSHIGSRDKQHDRSTILFSMPEKQIAILENPGRQSFQDSGIFMEDGFANEVNKVSPTYSKFPAEQTFVAQGSDHYLNNPDERDNPFSTALDIRMEGLKAMVSKKGMVDMGAHISIKSINDITSPMSHSIRDTTIIESNSDHHKIINGQSISTNGAGINCEVAGSNRTVAANHTITGSDSDTTTAHLSSGQISTKGPESLAAFCSQLQGDLQVLACSPEKVRTQCTKPPPLNESDSSSDILSTASPLKITPMSKRVQEFQTSTPVLNLTPEYDSDSCTEEGESPHASSPCPRKNQIDYNGHSSGHRIQETPLYQNTARNRTDIKTGLDLSVHASSPLIASSSPIAPQPQSGKAVNTFELDKVHRSVSSVVRNDCHSEEPRILPTSHQPKSTATINPTSPLKTEIDDRVRALNLNPSEDVSPSSKPKGAPARRGRKPGSKIGGRPKSVQKPAESQTTRKGRPAKQSTKKQKPSTKVGGVA